MVEVGCLYDYIQEHVLAEARPAYVYKNCTTYWMEEWGKACFGLLWMLPWTLGCKLSLFTHLNSFLILFFPIVWRKLNIFTRTDLPRWVKKCMLSLAHSWNCGTVIHPCYQLSHYCHVLFTMWKLSTTCSEWWHISRRIACYKILCSLCALTSNRHKGGYCLLLIYVCLETGYHQLQSLIQTLLLARDPLCCCMYPCQCATEKCLFP